MAKRLHDFINKTDKSLLIWVSYRIDDYIKGTIAKRDQNLIACQHKYLKRMKLI